MTTLLTAQEASALRVGVNVIVRPGDQEGWTETWYPPQDWVALTGPCPTCDGTGKFGVASVRPTTYGPCPDCRDGRRIVPLYTECPERLHWDHFWCETCNGTKQRLVGRGSIEVVPVVTEHNGKNRIMLYADGRKPTLFLVDATNVAESTFMELDLDPLPVPGRDWGIVIDCVEVA